MSKARALLTTATLVFAFAPVLVQNNHAYAAGCTGQQGCDGQSSGLCNYDQQDVGGSPATGAGGYITVHVYWSPSCHTFWTYVIRNSSGVSILAKITTGDGRVQQTNRHDQNSIATNMLYDGGGAQCPAIGGGDAWLNNTGQEIGPGGPPPAC